MDVDIRFCQSAFKHGISEADIRWAIDQYLFDHQMPGEEYKNLLIGLDRNGNPLEILYNIFDDNTINVFHADKCRNRYLDLLEEQTWRT